MALVSHPHPQPHPHPHPLPTNHIPQFPFAHLLLHFLPLYTPIKNPIFFLSHSFLIYLNSTSPIPLPSSLFTLPLKIPSFLLPILKIPSFSSPTHFLSLSPSMATTSLHSLHLPRRHRLFRHQSTHLSSSPPFLTFDSLSSHLSASNFRQADEETRRLLISLAGEPAQKRGYVFFSEVQFISSADLLAIDDLWLSNSGGRLGYSVQRKVWEKSLRDFTKFFINVGWMRRLETEVEQFGYRSFPEEFTWELKDEMPEGHLPLTNALRGTQLLGSILMHPAFELEEDGGEENEEKERKDGFSRRLMKPDYSF